MKKYIQYTIALMLFCVVSTSVFISCKDAVISEDEYQIQHFREAQLKNIFTNEIVTLSDNFITKTTDLVTSVESFQHTKSIEKLREAQEKWLAMLKVWKRLELYNLGAVEDSFIHFEINRWETNINNINSYVNGSETINEAFIASKGSSSKGISAIEYLLFSSEANTRILQTFTTDANYQRRLQYLVALAENLQTKATELKALWVADEQNFISSLESGISGSQNQLTNAMIVLIEEIVISKLGNPLGNSNGGTVNPAILEAHRSATSLTIIQEHLNALKRCYLGSFRDDVIRWGYDDYLRLIGNEDLNNKVLEAFENCQEKINVISNPLKTEIVENTQKVTELRQSFNDLLVLIKVDLANTIGTTVTISDNDGD